jgi:formylglycine-generating enzyme required for sulfatase activity
MEFVEGQDFGTLLKEGRKFTADEIINFANHTGQAISAAWKAQIVHRDIKPSNILMARDGSIKVMDFGLAKNPATDLTFTEVIMGTANYISPEQAAGTGVDIRSDIYSLGAVLYELATLRPPYQGPGPASVIYQHATATPVAPRKLNAEIPATLEAVILRCLAKRAENRYQTPDEFLADIRAIRESEPLNPLTRRIAESLRLHGTAEIITGAPPVRVTRPIHGLVIGIVLFVVGVTWLFLHREFTRPPETSAAGPKPVAILQWEKDYRLHRANAEKFRDQGDWAKAAEEYRKARGVLPVGHPEIEPLRERQGQCDFERLRREGEEALAAENLETAISKLQEAIDLRPNDPKIDLAQKSLDLARYRHWMKQAEVKAGNSQYFAASQDYQKALEYAPPVEEVKAEVSKKMGLCLRIHNVDARLMEATQKGNRADLEVVVKELEELLKDVGVFEKDLRTRLQTAKEKLDEIRKAEAGENKILQQRLLVDGRKAIVAGNWKAAKEAFDQAFAIGMLQPEDEVLMRRANCAAGAPALGMVYIPAGKSGIGVESATEPNGPVHVVQFKAFLIDLREVTNVDYARFLAALDADSRAKRIPRGFDGSPPARPMHSVSWEDADAYARWAGKRLPTEREWERAASTDWKSEVRTLYPWGEEYGGGDGRSPCGCEGMATLPLEWTADWYLRYEGSKALSLDFGERKRVARGGWLIEKDRQKEAQVTTRWHFLPDRREKWLGFRCAKDAE